MGDAQYIGGVQCTGGGGGGALCSALEDIPGKTFNKVRCSEQDFLVFHQRAQYGPQ